MIDTVILEIPKGLYLVKDTDSSKWMLVKGHSYFSILARNFPKDGIYRPRLSFISRGVAKSLKIEFSIPKLLYGDNLQEVLESDFEAVIDKLKGVIESEYGIKIFRDNLRRAKVMSFHPSKNILFRDSFRANYIINILSKVNSSLKFDQSKTTFRNNGESFQIYSQAHSFVIYDKISDFHKTKNRAIDKDQTNSQKSLFALINESQHMQEVLRLEVRLSQRRKMNSVLEELGYNKNPLFEDIFKNNICQKIVRWYWINFIMKGNEFLFISQDKSQDILSRMMVCSQIRPKEALVYMGMISIIKESGGIRDLRNIIEPYFSQRSWYRLINQLNDISNLIEGSVYPPWIKEIERQLESFNPLGIEEEGESLKVYIKN